MTGNMLLAEYLSEDEILEMVRSVIDITGELQGKKSNSLDIVNKYVSNEGIDIDEKSLAKVYAASVIAFLKYADELNKTSIMAAVNSVVDRMEGESCSKGNG